MTGDQPTATRDAVPASWGAHGDARGYDIPSTQTLDRRTLNRHQETTLSGRISE